MSIKILTLAILFFLSLLSFFCRAEIADTLVVYEYVYETDTVWIEEETTRSAFVDLIPLNPVNNPKLEAKPATFPSNLIYDVENRNQSDMKKTTFATLLLLSLQNLSFSQPELNLKSGITNFVLKPNPHVYSALMLGDHYGIEFKLPIKDSDLSLSVGFEQRGYNVELIHYVHFLSHGEDAWYVSRSLDTYRSLPFLIYYQYLGLDLFAGYELKMFPEVIQDDSDSFRYSYRNEHALVAGFDKPLGRRFTFATKLYLGDLFYEPNPDPFHIISRTSLSFSFKYNLFRAPKINI